MSSKIFLKDNGSESALSSRIVNNSSKQAIIREESHSEYCTHDNIKRPEEEDDNI